MAFAGPIVWGSCSRKGVLQMQIVAISDTHTLHWLVENMPAGDVLIHAGDFMNTGHEPADIRSFNAWLGQQPFDVRIVCCGNHDQLFERSSEYARSMLTNAVYLEDEGVKIGGVSFWGSPYTPEFLNWAFMYPAGAGKSHWQNIPDDVDVLITHGPPWGILDQASPDEPHRGCKDLLKAVEEKMPKVHIFGHIHGGAGTFDNGVTRFVNASYLNERYRPLPPAGQVRSVVLGSGLDTLR